jgi:hypothetical protein
MPLHVIDAPRPPFVVRVGYFHPKHKPQTYYGSSSSSRYLNEPDHTMDTGSLWTLDREEHTDDEVNVENLRERVISGTGPRHVGILDDVVTATVPMPEVTPGDIDGMVKFLESPINVRCRRTWSDDAHPSHRWLYNLQGAPARLMFWVKLFGKDDQFDCKFKGLERIVKAGYTELGDRCIFYRHERQDRILPNSMKIETRGITIQTKRALYVLKGDYAGEYAVRIVTIPSNSLNQNEGLYACCSVNIETGAVNANVQYELRSGDVCQIEVDKEVFTRMDKEAQEIKGRKGVQRNPKKQRTTND